MEIIKIGINDLKPYKKNAKIHTQEQIEQIKKCKLWQKKNYWRVNSSSILLPVSDLEQKSKDTL